MSKTVSPRFRLAHISDLHFSKISFNPMQFFSKRWIGNANLLLRRSREFNRDQLFSLIDIFKKEQVDLVLISGDLTTTSLEKEFSEAEEFSTHLKYAGIEVMALPGNHDHYTKKDCKQKTFYRFFESDYSEELSPFSAFNLKEHRLSVKQLKGNWWLVALDTAYSNSLLSCHGRFSKELEKRLAAVLSDIPEGGRVIVANHFPLFTADSAHTHLMRDEALRNLFHKNPKVKFYLHGHTHRHCIADLRSAGLPIILDSGSAAHKKRGSWNLLDFSEKDCEVQVFRWESDKNLEKHWKLSSQNSFVW